MRRLKAAGVVLVWVCVGGGGDVWGEVEVGPKTTSAKPVEEMAEVLEYETGASFVPQIKLANELGAGDGARGVVGLGGAGGGGGGSEALERGDRLRGNYDRVTLDLMDAALEGSEGEAVVRTSDVSVSGSRQPAGARSSPTRRHRRFYRR